MDRRGYWILSLAACAALGGTACQAGTFNVKDYGAKGDGKTLDTVAIRNAVNAANNSPGPNTVHFPAGVYLVENVPLTQTHKNPCGAPFLDKPLADITLEGEGPKASILKRRPRLRDARIWTMNGATGVVVRRLGFDVNGVDRFGGVACYTNKRLTIRDCRVFDGAPTPLNGFDRMGLMIMGCEDLEILDNTMDETQMEVDHCRRVKIVGNVVERPRETGGIGLWAHGGGAEDVLIQGNWIIDPSGVNGGAILAQMDGVGPKYFNSTFRNIRILDNVIVLGTKYKDGRNPPAIKIGAPDNSQAYQGVVFDGITVQGNRIYADPSLGIKTPKSGLVFVNASPKSKFVLDNLTIKDNTFYCGEQAMLMKVSQKGKNAVEESNERKPYAPPPAPPDVLAKHRDGQAKK